MQLRGRGTAYKKTQIFETPWQLNLTKKKRQRKQFVEKVQYIKVSRYEAKEVGIPDYGGLDKHVTKQILIYPKVMESQ